MIPPIPLPPFPRKRGKGGFFCGIFGRRAAAQKSRYSSPPPHAAARRGEGVRGWGKILNLQIFKERFLQMILFPVYFLNFH